jgi:outer membrane lipoprotein LolB
MPAPRQSAGPSTSAAPAVTPWRVARQLFGAALAAALCACATPERIAVPPARIAADEPFVVDGRLSARRGAEAITANFTWRHDAPRDELTITTPLGQEVAELHGDKGAGRVQVRTADGRTGEAPDWSTMTEQALGYRLPVDDLAAWVRGAPHGAGPHSVEYDAQGRPLLLRQQGWEILYAYPDDAARRPSRLRVIYPDLEVRIVIDRWG